jgi:hypothetical protein
VTGVAEKTILRSLTVHTNVSCQCNLPAHIEQVQDKVTYWHIVIHYNPRAFIPQSEQIAVDGVLCILNMKQAYLLITRTSDNIQSISYTNL